MKQQKTNKISTVVETALKNLKDMADVNTIVGEQITTSTDDIIIPISKVSVLALSGGGEYGKVNIFKNSEDLPYSAGNGAIVSLKPCAFLIKQPNEDFKVLNVGTSNYDGLFDKIINTIGNINKNED